MIRELQLHRKSPSTIECYVTAVAQLACYYGRSPEQISIEEIRDFLHHLITVQKVAYSTCNQKVCGIRFFYRDRISNCGFPPNAAVDCPNRSAAAKSDACWRPRPTPSIACC